ncbi:non-ribosomal peptide synthetase [Nocardiopsis terrae]
MSGAPPVSEPWAGRSSVLVAGLAGVLARVTGEVEVRVDLLPPETGSATGPLVVRLRTDDDPTFRELLGRAEGFLESTWAESAADGASAPVRFETDESLADGQEEGALLLVGRLHDPSGGHGSLVRCAPGRLGAVWGDQRAGRLVRLVEAGLADPDTRLSELPLLTPGEYKRSVSGWNNTTVDYPDAAGRSLHALFERWAEATPNALAARFGDDELSYAELNARANQLASHLRRLGVDREHVVGMLLPRGLELPRAVMGILKSGGAYLPLDPNHPAERLAGIIRDSGCSVVVTTTSLAEALPDEVLPLCVDSPAVAKVFDAASEDDPGSAVDPRNLAYVLYTSGSSGRPKGVLVQHDSVVNMVECNRQSYGVGPGDRVLQYSNPCFDVSVVDFFATLCNGAALVLAPRSTLVDPQGLVELMRLEKVTFLEITTAVARLLDIRSLTQLRMINVGGEVLTGDVVAALQDGHRTVYNKYGPTETTVFTVAYLCVNGVQEDRTPIGSPVANHRAYVMDAHHNPMPVGVPGELMIGGAGVTRGYLGHPGLTAERFVPDPWSEDGGRLYRTGDRARWRTDGNLEFLGRMDSQIKMNGLRIEPGEVETALCSHEAVETAVVDVDTASGGQSLVAFVQYAEGRPVLTTGEMRRHLSDVLPSALIPSRLVTVGSMPLNRNGKIDRRRLSRTEGA